jgi:hypothetical protein
VCEVRSTTIRADSAQVVDGAIQVPLDKVWRVEKTATVEGQHCFERFKKTEGQHCLAEVHGSDEKLLDITGNGRKVAPRPLLK